MMIRATENYRFYAMSNNLETVRNQTAQVLESLATGKNINQISDDPEGSVTLEKLQASLEYSAQYQRNLDLARPWVEFSQTNLEQAESLISEARQIAVAFSDGSASDSEKQTAVMRLDQIMNGLLETANAKLDGRCVFAGSNADEPAFVETGGDPPVVYNGDGRELSVNVDANLALTYNIAGNSTFVSEDGSVDAFQAVYDLKTALENDDVAGIQGQVETLRQAGDQVLLGVSRTGAVLGRMELAENHHAELQARISDMISNIQDADMARLAAEYQMTEIGLNAAYSVSSKIQTYSLLNFLK